MDPQARHTLSFVAKCPEGVFFDEPKLIKELKAECGGDG